MNVWLCCGCNHEIQSVKDPLYCEWCGSQTLKDLGEDISYNKEWRKLLDEVSAPPKKKPRKKE